MAFKATQDLYTDKDPNSSETGRVLTEGDPDIRFTLAAKGALIDDRIADKFKLEFHDLTEPSSAEKVRAELVAANAATYNRQQSGVILPTSPVTSPAGAIGAPPAPPPTAQTLAELLPGVDSRAVKSLQDAGFTSLAGIASASEQDLTALGYVKGETYDKIRSISNPV